MKRHRRQHFTLFCGALKNNDFSTPGKADEIRQHFWLINLLRVTQSCSGVNKMDCDTAEYKPERFRVISTKMNSMLIKTGEIQGQKALEVDPSLSESDQHMCSLCLSRLVTVSAVFQKISNIANTDTST